MINDIDKLYLPAEFIARHDVAIGRWRAHGSGGGIGHFPTLDLTGNSTAISALNISAFRHLDVSSEAREGALNTRVFRSSGTSAQGKSRSGFSAAGLDAYRSAITSGFTQVLRQYGANPKMRGISLIPSSADWPESSLAAMVEWLGEKAPVAYLTIPEEATKEASFLNDFGCLLKSSDAPFWIFGTAFHFVPLIDRGLLPALPKGSLVFYTGGTKGKVRDVGEAWLIESLAKGFKISPRQIISEYGMSELASAAYTLPRPERPLRFQENVVPFVVDGLKHAQNGDAQARGVAPLAMTASRSGTGLLGVFDFNRIDVPAPIITEDVVRLAADGTFELLGRAHTAPLKGCSLLADGSGHGGAKTTHRQAMPTRRTDKMPVQQIAHRFVLEVVQAFVKSEEAFDSMARAIESKKAAQIALSDLLVSISKVAHSRDAWARCLVSSGVQAAGSRLLFIPPNTHPLGLVYPLTIALAAGCAVSIRLNREQNHSESFICRLTRRLRAVGIQVELLPPEFRLGENQWTAESSSNLTWDSVVIFGDDSTIAEIRSSVPKSTRIIGHGEAIAISIVDHQNLDKNLPKIFCDTFSLMQRGCMSSRLLGIVVPPKTTASDLADEVQKAVQQQWWSAWGEALPARHQAGMLLRSLDQPNMRWTGRGMPMVQVAINEDPATFGPQIKVCPLVTGTPLMTTLARWKKAWPQIKLVTAPPELDGLTGLSGVDLRPLGRANQPTWDGLHFGQPIFQPS